MNRIAVVHPTSLLGKELRERLETRAPISAASSGCCRPTTTRSER